MQYAAQIGAQEEGCPTNEFYCPEPSGSAPFSCLPSSWRCDGAVDCKDNGKGLDEIDCPPVNCSNFEFNCGHSCIDSNWQCDHEDDCAFGEDEVNCTTSSPDTCTDNEFFCSIENDCIPLDWHCDGEPDCVGDEDERECPTKGPHSACETNEFQCINGNCVDIEWLCDKYDDCGDLSDEPPSCNSTCAQGKLQCPHSEGVVICIEPDWLCDGDPDCPGAWDESRSIHNCTTLSCNEFSCETSGECYPLSWVCDGAEDCTDGSDEAHPNCTEPVPRCIGFLCWATNSCLPHSSVCNGSVECPDGTDEANCSLCQFRCQSNGQCVSMDEVCDGNITCIDGSDESNLCQSCSVGNGGCAVGFQCIDHPTGPRCVCREGYTKVDNHCYDINECSTYGKCSQTCVNTHGSYTCKCNAGYQHDPQASSLGLDCKALGPPGYVYAGYNRQVIKYSITGHASSVVLRDLDSVVDLAVDYNNSMIYWTEHLSKSLKKASLSSPWVVVDVVSSDMENPEGLSLDWIQQRLYWVDDGKGTVEVVDTDGSDRRTLKSGLDRPRDLVVDPLNGCIYVTMWGSTPGIAKLSTDGSDFTVLVGDSVGWPNGIALDLPGQRLYWVDGRHKVIESIRTDGTGRVTVRTLPQNSHPFSISVFENWLFVSDFNNHVVKVFDRFSGEDVKTFPRNSSTVSGVSAVQQSLQPPSTFCPRPNRPFYNTAHFKSQVYQFGDVLNVICQEQAQLKEGSFVVKCEDSGHWFPPLPECILKTTAETPPGVSTPKPSAAVDELVGPDSGQQGAFEGKSFAIGFVVGFAIFIIILLVLAIVVFVVCKRLQTSRTVVSSFNNPLYYKKSAEATISLPSAIETDEDGSVMFDSATQVTNGNVYSEQQ